MMKKRNKQEVYLIYSLVKNDYYQPYPKTLEEMRDIGRDELGEEKFFIFKYVPANCPALAYFVNVDDDTDIRRIPECLEGAAQMKIHFEHAEYYNDMNDVIIGLDDNIKNMNDVIMNDVIMGMDDNIKNMNDVIMGMDDNIIENLNNIIDDMNDIMDMNENLEEEDDDDDFCKE